MNRKITSNYFLLQVVDNHVVKYIPPEKYEPVIGKKKIQVKNVLGSLIVGAESADPQYVIIFRNS